MARERKFQYEKKAKNLNFLKGHNGYVFCLLKLNSNEIISGSGDKIIKFGI